MPLWDEAFGAMMTDMNHVIADRTYLRTLKLIRRADGISRSELAAAMGLTKAALTSVAADLLNRGLVSERRLEPGRRGRPNYGLTIVPTAAYALCARIWTDGVALFEILDLQGTAVYSSEAKLGTLAAPLEFTRQLIDQLDGVLAQAGVDRDAVQHLAIVLPARIDRREGVVHWLTPGAAHPPLDLSGVLDARFGIPVTIDNRTTILARGEHWFGPADGSENFTYIGLVGRGIGAARYVDGTLQLGANGMGGEFAHSKLVFDGGLPCHCGGTGCTIAYASIMAISRAFAAVEQANANTVQEIDEWFDMASRKAIEGDDRALAIFNAAGRALGVAAASQINSLDPGRVIIGCDRPDLLELIAPEFHRSVKSQVLPELLGSTALEVRKITQESYRLGATALALEHLYLDSSAPRR